MRYAYNDGGRKEAGYKGHTRDCVVRAISIALEKPYQEVYDAMLDIKGGMRQTRRISKSHPRKGVNKRIYNAYLKAQGWSWVATMGIGTGCRVHLRAEELPMGRIVARVSKHLVAIVDGVIQDTHDCSRDGQRCVYGYWHKEQGNG